VPQPQRQPAVCAGAMQGLGALRSEREGRRRALPRLGERLRRYGATSPCNRGPGPAPARDKQTRIQATASCPAFEALHHEVRPRRCHRSGTLIRSLLRRHRPALPWCATGRAYRQRMQWNRSTAFAPDPSIAAKLQRRPRPQPVPWRETDLATPAAKAAAAVGGQAGAGWD